jgi:cell division protein FtsB
MSATQAARRAYRQPPQRATVRWDRLGRIAMLIVLLGLAYLYIGAVRSYIVTYLDSGHRQAVISRLRHENSQLRARRNTLLRPSTLDREARDLGMIRPNERPYIIQGLPAR